MQLERFLQILERNKAYLTSQQYRTLKGAAGAGDVNGSYRGLQKLIRRVKRRERQKNN